MVGIEHVTSHSNKRSRHCLKEIFKNPISPINEEFIIAAYSLVEKPKFRKFEQFKSVV